MVKKRNCVAFGAAILGGGPANEEFSEKPLRVLRLKTKKAAIKQV